MAHWIEPHPTGIYVRPADAWIDPSQPQERALVTHGHADHARGLRHAAALVEGGQEGPLPDRGPAGGGEDGRRGLRGRGWTVSFPRVDQRIAV